MTSSSRQEREGRRPKALIGLWVFVAFVVWNGIFDILVTRGVKEYLYRQADYELGYGRAVTLREIMDQTVKDAVVTASLWALFVGGAGMLTLYVCRRQAGHASPDL
jgi:hypothetical protein